MHNAQHCAGIFIFSWYAYTVSALIVTVGRGISSKSDTNLFQGFLFTIPFQPVSLNKKMCTLYVATLAEGNFVFFFDPT